MLAWSGDIDPNAASSAARDSPYPPANTYKEAFSGTGHFYDPPKKKVDAIAEAWGVHEPEPFNDFSAGGGRESSTPASSVYNGKDSARAKRKETARDFLNEEPPRRAASKRAPLPPPQPIFVPEANHPDLADPLGSPTLASGSPSAVPKRNRSIMSRIRKMRDSPNVPVVADYETREADPPSPDGAEGSYPSRPTHRTQNSFMGRFGGNKDTSPTQENYERAKDLPPTPYGQAASPYQDQDGLGYFEEQGYGGAPGQAPGRKTTIMRKVKGVVRGGR